MIHKFPWRSTLTVAFLIGISAPAAAAPEMKLRPGHLHHGLTGK